MGQTDNHPQGQHEIGAPHARRQLWIALFTGIITGYALLMGLVIAFD
jgi:hypothetical protein